MSNVVEFLSNPSRRKRRKSSSRRRRKMTARQRAFFGKRRSARRRRVARRNPSTYITVPATMNPSRRRRFRRNPAGLGGVKRAIGPGVGAALGALAGWVLAKTFLKEKDQGLVGAGANLAGSIAFATVASATVARKMPGVKAGLWVGAIAGPVLRFAVDSLRGRTIPFVQTGFEDCGPPMTMSDFFVPRPGGSGSMGDFLMPRNNRVAALAGALGYSEGGATPFGAR